MPLTSTSSSQGTSKTADQYKKNFGISKSTPTNTQGKCDEITHRVTEVFHTQEYTVLQGLLELPKKVG